MALSERMKNLIRFLNGFRKFTIMIALICVAVIFRVMNYINGQQMVDLLSATGVAFMGTNAVEHMTKAVIEWVKKK